MARQPHNTPARVVVAVSGRGRTLANLLACQNQGYQVCGVITSNAHCHGAAIAKAEGLPLFTASFADPDAIGAALYAWIGAQNAHWVALAGFLKMFPLDEAWRGRILNVHPSLLPAFGGKGMYGERVHAAVIASGSRETGASVHVVSERYDEGQVLAQARVSVRDGDTSETLAARVFAAECQLYPRVLRGLVNGELPLANGAIMRWDHDLER